MLRGFSSQYMVTLTVLLLTLTSSLGSAQDDISLPGWKSNAEYVTQCLNNGQPGALCDMTVVQQGKVTNLNIGPLSLNGEACLEFWYLSPVLPNLFRLTVYFRGSNGLQKIWSTTAQSRSGDMIWTQVFVPLSNVRPGTQVVFRTIRPMSRGEQVIVNRIGIRKGPCGAQCEASTHLWPDQSTRCLCSEGQLSCSHAPSSGMCTVHSHTDCSTFDGALFRFMAPCSYTLAKSCSVTPGSPHFSVEVVNRQSDNSSLPSVEQVNVNINDFRMSFIKRQTKRVVVNGVWRTLPLTLNGGIVTVSSNPAAVVLKISFGLSVSFDYTGALHVTLPTSYSDQVCGLCGNFNHNKWDDLQRPDGTEAQNTTDLVDSWQTGGNASACEVIQVPHYCDPLEEAEYASEAYCGALGSHTGPFAACQEVLGADSYFRGCVHSMCSSHGDPEVLCDSLQVYADVCKRAGVNLPMWRNSSFCSLQCVENSHYNSCAEGCPEVCSPLDQVLSCGSCVERCECDPGFKLSGGKCVQAEDCGCWRNGQHHEKGAIFMEGECDQQCLCVGNNNIQCRSSHCSASEVCSVQNGVKGCFTFSPATCSVYGDPHYITFDGFAYDFNGGCSYVLTTTCGGQSSVEFTVIGHNMHPPHNNFSNSKLEAVTLEVGDLQITINQSGYVHNHNSPVLLPYFTSGTYGQVRTYEDSGYTVLETTFGLRMMMDRKNRLFLQVNEHYKYELCGLCGTYSGRQDDDLVMPGGQNATNAFQFADSWRVEDSNWCVSHPNEPRQCNSLELEQAYNHCYVLLREDFSLCHETIHPEIYITSCVHDYCAENGNFITLCEAFKSYAAACAVAGVDLGHWQGGTICAILQSTVSPMTTSTASPAPDQSLCPLNCDFENNLCGWEQLVQDSFDWTRHSGATPSSQTGPSNDHTNGVGFYMYIEGDSVTHGDSARMLSSLCQYERPMCLRFWYHMFGSATAMALNIYLLEGNRATKIWSKQNNHGSEWKPGYVDITTSGPYKIILEGIRGSTVESDVAIDDISIHFGSCSDSFPDLASGTKPPQTTIQPILPQVCNLGCNFDQSLCNWNQMMTDAFDWTWLSGSTPTLMTGPSADHTGGGHYLYIEASSVTYGDTARLISSECSNSGAQCLQFWYHMYGSADTMGLHVYVVEGTTGRLVWRQRNDQGNMWHLAQVDLTTTGPFQIIFEGRRGSNDQSDVALDDVSLYYGPCSDMNKPATSRPATSAAHISTTSKPQTTAGQEPATTQEQTASSDGPQSPTTDQTVEVTTAPEPTTEAEPEAEITTDGSQPTTSGALQTTPVEPVEPTRPTEGKTTKGPQQPTNNFTGQTTQDTAHLHTTLAGDQSTVGAGNTEQPTPSQGPHHTTLEEPETAPTQAATIGQTIQPTRPAEGLTTANQETSATSKRPQQTSAGTNEGSNVTSPPQTTAARPETGASTERPQPPTEVIPQACSLNCNFDQSLCNWNQMVTDAFDWTWHSGATPTLMTGPSADHTGGGHYLYIEASSVTYGDTARLISSECFNSGDQCLQFWYHMYGSADTMGLHVYVVEGTIAHSVWRQRNDQGNMWHFTQVDLTTTGPFQIIFEGRRGSNDQSDVAIDDVSLHYGPCLNRPTTAAPITTSQVVTTALGTSEPAETPAPPPPPTDSSTAAPPTPTTTAPHTTTGAQTTTVPTQTTTTLSPPPPPTTTANPLPPETPGPTAPPTPTTTAPHTTTGAQPTTAPTQTTTTVSLPPPTTTASPLPPETPSPTPSCPRNSHYSSCVSACAPTCSHLYGSPGCSESDCVPGCVCDDGYVLERRKCVPIQECGCIDLNGKKYNFGDVWYLSHCSEKCKCEKRRGVGRIECEEQEECDGKAVCLQNSNGEYFCEKTDFSDCTINGDPEYRTFDNKKHDFEGEHSYMLVQTNNLPINLQSVYIEGINGHSEDDEDSSEERHSRQARDDSDEDDDDSDEDSDEDKEDVLRALKIRVYNHTVVFKPHRKLVVDGSRVDTPLSPSAGLKIKEHSSRIYLQTDFGLSVEFDGHSKAEIILPHVYKRKVGGLCGNFDGHKHNDFMKPDGTQATNVQDFGESWRV
ncbi:zonadhesin-like [Boleophthalmus pectinirostris]|uniref:zonadhesin-like n=1 Tax=Boleophthalmus pectinirostris TaxID=150288 RepID=UPI00242E72AF|nr:zonadhesin-like [Boleophthalmus pectinirostris]